MKISRRKAMLAAAATLAGTAAAQERRPMYGLIGKMRAVPGKRDELAAILVDSAAAAMPGCLCYIVAKDLAESDALWVTEVWETEAAHEASLALPSVKQAIAKGRPLIASFDARYLTEPIGGHGLKK